MYSTVKHAYKDRTRDQQNVLLIHRWSLYAGSIAWKYTPGDLQNAVFYKHVVLI